MTVTQLCVVPSPPAGASKFDQEAGAHRLEQPSEVLGDLGLDDFGPQGMEVRQVPTSSLPMSLE